jgi:phenylacetyl-CoA:acceptor oxidoreductase
VPLRGEGFDLSLPPGAAPPAEEIWDRVCRAATRALTGGAAEHDLAWFREHGAFFVPFPRTRYYLHAAMAARGLRYELPYQERIRRLGAELGARLHERGITWWDAQIEEYQALPAWKDFPAIWRQPVPGPGAAAGEYPFWLLTSRSMQYSWGANVSLPVMAEVARHVRGHFGVMLNRGAARRLGIADGDLVEIVSPTGRTEGRAILREGVRPDVAVVLQQFGHWVTPFARDLGMPNLNQVARMDLALTDATGSGADLVPVAVRRLGAAAGGPDPGQPPAGAAPERTAAVGPSPATMAMLETYCTGS